MPEVQREQLDMALITPEEERNIFQRVSVRTNGWLTPANVLDVASVGTTAIGVRNIEKRWGKALLISSFLIDLVDGKIAKWTGTANEQGGDIDKVTDRVRMLLTFPTVWKKDMVSKPLLAAVSARQVVNMATTGYDFYFNKPPRLHQAADEGRRAAMGELVGLGLTAVSSSLSESHPIASTVGEIAGGAITSYFFLTDGLTSTRQYIDIATASPAKGLAIRQHNQEVEEAVARVKRITYPDGV